MKTVINSVRSIIEEINTYIGGRYSSYYVGITDDPERRLFVEHNVPQNGDWVYKQSDSDESARAVENHFLDLGCQGGPRGGSDDSTYVYAYKITADTVQ